MTGASATRNSPENRRGFHAGFTLAGGSMVENNLTKSNAQETHPARNYGADPGSL
jgi:hypothetical protein